MKAVTTIFITAEPGDTLKKCAEYCYSLSIGLKQDINLTHNDKVFTINKYTDINKIQ